MPLRILLPLLSLFGSPHKLASRATSCIFLGYPVYHKGYRCLDLSSNKIILSKHVTFDEEQFPYSSLTSTNSPSYSYLIDGTLSHYKARLVANGSNQQLEVGCDETFSPVIKLTTIHMRSLYGLKQAPRAWFNRFARYATCIGFSPSRCDSSLFIYRHGAETAYLLIYVDDIMLTASSSGLLQRIISSLHKEFDMTDLGALNYFLGNYVRRVWDFLASPTTSLTAYSDADWVGCPATPRFMFGYCVFLGDNLHSCSSKRQPTLSQSSAKVEYHGVANAVAETAWIHFRELHTSLFSATTVVYCDNVSAIYLTANPVQHQRTKHIKIDIHFVRDMVARGQVHVLHVPY
ncbi:ribonuclease H-like domain-containing protein [Tanacetum coccineum]